jgi:hypothetical protein
MDSLILKTIKEVEDLNYDTPEGIIRDSDTILVDLLNESDFEFSGISQDIFNIYKKSKDKESVKEMFFEFAGMEFEEYLAKCLEEITREESLSNKFLVTVVKTYEHTYLVESKSKEEAIDIVNEEHGGARETTDSFSEEYFVRIPNKNDDLDLYEECS